MALSFFAGSYTGNGSDPQTISGVGFQPTVVIIFGTAGAGDAFTGCLKTAYMTTGAGGITATLGANGQQTSGLIDTLNSDGFTVRGAKNTNAVTFYYLAFAGTSVATGTYTGDGVDNRSITAPGFTPGWVIVQGGNNSTVHHSTAVGASTDNSQFFEPRADAGADAIQSLDATGFTVGTSLRVNGSGTTYYWVAFDSAATNMQSGSYTGNGSDNRDITGLSFTPTGVIIKRVDANSGVGRGNHAGDLSGYFFSTAPAANLIQSFGTNLFQVGTATEVNQNSAGDYYWIAFSAPVAASTGRDGRYLSILGVG